jgi:bacterioferritin-associated ferredoxin
MKKNKKEDNVIICFCNNISQKTIRTAIQEGAQTLNDIYDQTTAGVGPCGGSCRRKIAPQLESFLNDGTFPEPEKKS